MSADGEQFDQGIAEPQLSASWFPANGAVYYIADVSYDQGNTWIQVYEGADNKFSRFKIDRRIRSSQFLRDALHSQRKSCQGDYGFWKTKSRIS